MTCLNVNVKQPHNSWCSNYISSFWQYTHDAMDPEVISI